MTTGVQSPREGAPTGQGSAVLRHPTSLYSVGLWRAGLWVARTLPRTLVVGLCRLGLASYRALHPQRREVVVQNLLPACDGDRREAACCGRALFREFAIKVADVWRLEAGVPLEKWRFDLGGWENLAAAQARGRGVLLLTPHLGSWEWGGPVLARRGVKLLVISQAEPEAEFTELRRASRARWGIETIIVGQEPFAFVEIIKRLQDGAAVALLIDRPPASAAVEVELFGRPFAAAVGPAELARASGCALVGVYVVRTPSGRKAQILPEIAYDRRAIGTREGRQQLTQQIVRVFEPVIRQYRDQWFHFVPIWTQRPSLGTDSRRPA
jgi:lauroyl/myristoyl acyltransferase